MPWTSYSHDYRYFVVTQAERIEFSDGTVAQLLGDVWLDVWVDRPAGPSEAHRFVAATIGV